MARTQLTGALTAAIISCGLVSCSGSSSSAPDVVPSSPPSPPAATLVWATDYSSITNLQAADAATTQGFFDHPGNYLAGGNLAWQTTSVRAYASAAAFAGDVTASRIPPGTTTVLYDPEQWPQTPLSEQQQPSVSMAQFAQQAKAQGYQTILTPALNLMSVAGAECSAQSGETPQDAFIRCNIAGKAAVGDVVDIQWQRLESTPSQYASYVATSAGQARAVNPKVVFLTQLTTRTFAQQPTATTGCLMYQAYQAAKPSVQGFWVHVDPNNGQIGIDFLNLVDGVTASSSCP